MKQFYLAGAFCVMATQCGAFSLNGHYDITVTQYYIPDNGQHTLHYCLRLDSQGPLGPYRDHGAAYMLTPPANHYAYAGEYRVFKQQISVVVGNPDPDFAKWIYLHARLQGNQITDTFYNQGDYGFEDFGTIAATRNGGRCRGES